MQTARALPLSPEPATLGEAIRDALLTADPLQKVFKTRHLVRGYRQGLFKGPYDDEAKRAPLPMPERPRWPDTLELKSPSQMPRRSKGTSQSGRIALWHALAHIEFVAIDLALDIVGRFGGEMGAEFTEDFLSVAADEAMHFALLARKLETLGSYYTALPAHGGLWQSALDTAHDIAARLAIVPMVLEARGLDVTPATLAKVRAQGDENGGKILARILDDEIRHVRFGTKYFERIAKKRGIPPEKLWQSLVQEHFAGRVKGPFNDSARESAGLSRDYYLGIAS